MLPYGALGAFARSCRGLLGSALVVVLATTPADGQARRALIVGINDYQPATALAVETGVRRGRDPIGNLEGAVNDARAIAGVLVNRYRFPTERIRQLTDREATRAAILEGLAELVGLSGRGDVLVVYFAGHGAERRNTLTTKPNRRDQTLVPADANLGVPDIRGPEVSRLVGQAAARGARVILIFDSCHSGGITRGLPRKGRWAGFDTTDVADGGVVPPLAELGVAVLTAARDDQLAAETHVNGVPRGRFTLALIDAMLTTPANISIGTLHRQVAAALRGSGADQEPVLDAADERTRQSLFGVDSQADEDLVPVVGETEDGRLELSVGLAAGIGAGTELASLDSTIRLVARVDSGAGLARSTATVLDGDIRAVRAGMLLRVVKRSLRGATQVRIWVPPVWDSVVRVRVDQALGILRRRGVQLDTLAADSLAEAVWLVPTTTGWELREPDARSTGLGTDLGLDRTLDRVVKAAGRWPGKPVLVLAGISPDIGRAFSQAPDSLGIAVETVARPEHADYLLQGRLANGVAYRWSRPGALPGTATALPSLAPWVPDGPGNILQLMSGLRRLARAYSWLTLAAPEPDGTFPYRLEIRDQRGRTVAAGSRVTPADSLWLMLTLDSAAVLPLEERERRYVYVFAIDQEARSQLLYPRAGSPLNRLPYLRDGAEQWPRSVDLRGPLAIRRPFGIDTYVLLTTTDPVPQEALQWRGLDRGSGTPANMSPIARLLTGLGITRAPEVAPPTTWGLDRVLIRSAPR